MSLLPAECAQHVRAWLDFRRLPSWCRLLTVGAFRLDLVLGPLLWAKASGPHCYHRAQQPAIPAAVQNLITDRARMNIGFGPAVAEPMPFHTKVLECDSVL